MNRKYGLVVLIIFASLVILLCLKLFCANGRYQIAFGHVRMTYRECDEEKTDMMPVCFKIDTLTGKCWIYKDYRWMTCDKKYGGDEGFEEIPKYTHQLPH